MEQTQAAARSPRFRQYNILLPAVIIGVFVALLALGAQHYFVSQGQEDRATAQVGQLLTVAQAALHSVSTSTMQVSQALALRLNKADRAQALDAHTQYSTLWPDIRFSFYDQRGEGVILEPGRSTPQGAGAKAGLRDLVARVAQQNDINKGQVDFTVADNRFGVHAGAGVEKSFVKTVVASRFFSTASLQSLSEQVKAPLTVIALDSTLEERSASSSTAISSPLVADMLALAKGLSPASPPTLVTFALQGQSTLVGVLPLVSLQGQVTGALFVGPVPPPVYRIKPWLYETVAAGLGLVAMLLALFFLRREQQSTLASCGIALALLPQLDPVNYTSTLRFLPPLLQELFHKFAESVFQERKMLEGALAQCEAGNSRPERGFTEGSALPPAYLQFFNEAPYGLFQCSYKGEIVLINHAFATLLGYDSTAQLLAEHASLHSLCADAAAGDRLLHVLKEQPRLRHGARLSLREGREMGFWVMATSNPVDKFAPVEGFLLDRSLDERLEHTRHESLSLQERVTALSLLLLAICQQSQAYFLPALPGCAGAVASLPQTPDDPATEIARERRAGISSLTEMFDDIHKIAVLEYENRVPLSSPITIATLLERIIRQALPALSSRGVELRSEIPADIPGRIFGVAPVLRHALLRALFAVVAPVQGGKAILSVARDVNTPRLSGTSTLIFSASWTLGKDTPPTNNEPELAEFGVASSLGDEGAPEPIPASLAPLTSLGINEECAVIRFLAHKMNGTVLSSTLTSNLRAIQFTVQLDHPALADEGTQPPVKAPALAQAPKPAEPAQAFRTTSYTAAPVDTALSILVEDTAFDQEQRQQDSLTILLVEDDYTHREIFSLCLQDTPHTVMAVANGQEGVEAFLRKPFDVIFMDMAMPILDGYQATRIIRALEAERGLEPIPIVALTAQILPENKEQAMQAGCSDFLTKPFSSTALLGLLEGLIQAKREQVLQ